MSTFRSTDDVKLNILIEGDNPFTYAFTIKISRNETFSTLITVIQSEYREARNRAIFNLKLFKFELPDNEVKNFQFLHESALSPRKRVSSVWPPDSSIDEGLIHIIVRCTVILPSSPVLDSAPELLDAPSTGDQLHELAKRFRRAQISFNKSTARQSSAEIQNFRQQQETPDFIRNGRPAMHTGLSIVLYHPVFGQFLSKLQSNDPLPPAVYFQTTHYFSVSQELYQFGHDHRLTARDQSNEGGLNTLLGTFLSESSASNTKPDGLATGRDGAGLIIVKMQNEIGDGGSDPSIQAALSYSRYWCHPMARTILDKCCCPSILVATAGPWMAILGAVFLDRPVVQPLTHFLWVGHDPARPSELEYLARVFHCVSSAREELAKFYRDLPAPQNSFNLFCPYITHYTDLSGHQIEFRYLKPLSKTYPANDMPVFLAETRNEDHPRQIIVKFVQAYNAEAHKLLAEQELAPQLLYDGTANPQDQPGPDHTMVVMEFLHGTDLSKFNIYPLPDAVFQDIDRALAYLHDHCIVFGDLRDPNVMIMQNSRGEVTGAKLIDFDWCGTHQVGRYPLNMNPDIDWAEGVGPGALMDKCHDIEMRGRLNLICCCTGEKCRIVLITEVIEELLAKSSPTQKHHHDRFSSSS